MSGKTIYIIDKKNPPASHQAKPLVSLLDQRPSRPDLYSPVAGVHKRHFTAGRGQQVPARAPRNLQHGHHDADGGVVVAPRGADRSKEVVGAIVLQKKATWEQPVLKGCTKHKEAGVNTKPNLCWPLTAAFFFKIHTNMVSTNQGSMEEAAQNDQTKFSLC